MNTKNWAVVLHVGFPDGYTRDDVIGWMGLGEDQLQRLFGPADVKLVSVHRSPESHLNLLEQSGSHGSEEGERAVTDRTRGDGGQTP